jgi:hypothetical protein
LCIVYISLILSSDYICGIFDIVLRQISGFSFCFFLFFCFFVFLAFRLAPSEEN